MLRAILTMPPLARTVTVSISRPIVVVPRIQRSRWLEAAARWVSLARQEGFLPPVKPRPHIQAIQPSSHASSWAIRQAHRVAPVVKRHAPMAAIVT